MDFESCAFGEMVTVRAPAEASTESIVTVDMYLNNTGTDGTIFWNIMDKDSGKILTDVNGELFYKRSEIASNRGMRIVGTFIMPGRNWSLVAQCGHEMGGLDLVDTVTVFTVVNI